MPAIFIYRLGNFFSRIKLNPVGRIFSYLNRLLFSVWLPSSAQIGKNFKLSYWGLGTVIHHNTIIGDNVTIGQNVTIGRNIGDENVPVIGNDVYIGTGTVIFGEIKIGNNVMVGANSVINKSIPDNTTVVGNPFKIIEEGRKKKYYEIDESVKSKYWDFWFKAG